MLAQVGQGSVSVLCAGGLRENCVCHATRAAEDHPVCKRYLPSCSAFLGGGPVWKWAGEGGSPPSSLCILLLLVVGQQVAVWRAF